MSPISVYIPMGVSALKFLISSVSKYVDTNDKLCIVFGLGDISFLSYSLFNESI